MNKQIVKDALGWGFVLWMIGYALGMMLFAFVPTSLIGWIIMPIGTVIALWVAFRKVNGDTLRVGIFARTVSSHRVRNWTTDAPNNSRVS